MGVSSFLLTRTPTGAFFSNSPTDRKVPDGVRYHLLDLYLDELEKFFPSEDDEEADANNADKTTPPISQLIAPIEELAANASTKPIRKRAKDVLEDERIEQWKKISS